ncbi:MAG: peroxidase [Rhodobacteraceae bacterium]|nr:peroxidase [Paracoccaceae bacterium]
MFPVQKHGTKAQISSQSPLACGDFDYLFPNGAPAPFDHSKRAAFTAFHQALIENSDTVGANNSPLPPIFTYFGQFIDHDITGQMAVDGQAAETVDIFGADFDAQPKQDVARAIKNARTGRFDLDSLYGPALPTGNHALDKLIGLMRYPKDRAKMWLARPESFAGGIPDKLPKDGAADLLRLRRLMVAQHGEAAPHFSKADFEALPAPNQALHTLPNGDINMRSAVIGEARNDENLVIAQLQVAFLRFHNRVVDAYPHARTSGDQEIVFNWAREQVRFHYQWLVMNAYLPAVCDPVVVQQIIASGGQLYGDFLQSCHHEAGTHFPMPLEFSVAAFRFGHSMVRGNYDWNSNFGRGPSETSRARFQELFLFTGGSHTPLGGKNNVPENWIIDWHRMALPNSEFADRSTRLIDTNIALPLSTMVNEGEKPHEKNLAARNLKRSIRMSIPAAQSCIEALNTRYGLGIVPLTHVELTSGKSGPELEATGFAALTPLWYYVLKEAELRQAGQRLGPLGSHIVAGTIAGLILHDPNSYWNQKGSQEGRWHPADGVRPSGQLVDSIPAMLRAALLMEG